MHAVLRPTFDKDWENVNVPVCAMENIQVMKECPYLVRTMETASLRMLSPNTSILRTGSTLSALNMAMVATGSTAEISEPKAKLQQSRRE